MARTLSILLHPFIAVTVTLALVAYFVDLSTANALWWTTLFSLVVVAPVMILLLVQLWMGSISGIDVGLCEQRLLYYTVGISSLIVLFWLFWHLAAPRSVLIFVSAATICNIAAVIINRVTKVSVHAAAMAGCTAITVGTLP